MKLTTFEKRSVMPVPADELFAWHAREGAFERLNPPFAPAEIEERSGGLEVGARTVVKIPVGPTKQRWVAEHTAFEPGRMFRDEQTSGPFAKWVHTHRFEPLTESTSTLIDTIEYALPLGGIVGGSFTDRTLERMFDYRHAITRADLSRHHGPRRVFAIAGASGLVGSALKAFLSTGGHEVRVIKRGDFKAVEGAEVVVNLAGAGIADERWSDERKRELVESRVDYTKKLVAHAKGVKVWLQGSAVGIYGERGDEVLTEDSAPGAPGDHATKFLSKLCLDWEAAAQGAAERVVLLRTGIVQSAQGGALAKLLPAFKLGAGGPIAGGKAWQSWVSIEDMLGLILFAAQNENVVGPLNLTSPNPVTSGDYARVLGRVLSRPAIAPLPGFALRALFGEMADGAILASQRALPQRAQSAGFTFLHPDLEQALRFTLGR
ncbi:MAG: TIGR01777 family protein [Archangium gephyra]|uniref:TIGR01777 family protein n=1 Tax=Archangium gephyra TaxID=48 RepID=A0A2W5TU44_9BACT|nr:MAG: TIGR01777 family protein [Archangium gephyra]